MPNMPGAPDNPFSQNFNQPKLQNFMQSNPFGGGQQQANDPQSLQNQAQQRARLIALQRMSGGQQAPDDGSNQQ